MDSEEGEDDFFISAATIEDDIYLQDTVYIESKSPVKIREISENRVGQVSKPERAESDNEKSSTSDEESLCESNIQIVDPPQDIKTATISPRKRQSRRRGPRGRQFRSDSDSDKSYRSENSQSPEPRPKRQKSSSTVASLLEPDENEEFFNEIAKETTARSFETRKINSEQLKRIYNIRFLSKLDGTINKTVQVKVLGKYELSSILPTVLERLVKKFEIPDVMRNIYAAENVSLYWNNAKLLKFMTCNSLGVAQTVKDEISNIDILMVPKEYESKFEEDIRIQLLKEEAEAAKEALRRKNNHEISTSNFKDQLTGDIDEFERELKNSEDIKNSHLFSNQDIEVECINLDSDDHDELIKVALVGDDNKKLYVNVRTSTYICKIVEYYKEHKDVPENAVIKLVFDHEELDQSQTVGQQDLEDEDMIEVVVI
ncbi:hypothetical protein HG535_0C04080 [Zygotorulaspora mrakii]|uniref:Rad60/SUMO-like domain-containing protein n=1 Tax=Zygotorulaspora mrakii TaxID=42260 RepID=A0A7H9B0Z7_ZYGMR|nr:uncharacterized protein HG535_0C04080 [Zygotorulaspora mrakii]QLG72054.1 hypothetical protein HG535_0C04080 [Zygotorulaspora mrakii]